MPWCTVWQETGTEQNSDEERFYMDETNWEMTDTQLATRHTHESSTEQQYENVTVRVGRRAVLPCFVGSEMDAATKVFFLIVY